MLPPNKLPPKNISHLLFISGGRIQLADLHHGGPNPNHTRSGEGAACLSPADEVLHGLVRPPRAPPRTDPPRPLPLAHDPLTSQRRGWLTSGHRGNPGGQPGPLRRAGAGWRCRVHVTHTRRTGAGFEAGVSKGRPLVCPGPWGGRPVGKVGYRSNIVPVF